MTRDDLAPGLLIALVLTVLGAGIFAIFYRHNADIVISARFWSWDARITYTTHDCQPSTTCDGKGHCITTIECETNTHTRCSANRRGMNLPPVARPDLRRDVQRRPARGCRRLLCHLRLPR